MYTIFFLTQGLEYRFYVGNKGVLNNYYFSQKKTFEDFLKEKTLHNNILLYNMISMTLPATTQN